VPRATSASVWLCVYNRRIAFGLDHHAGCDGGTDAARNETLLFFKKAPTSKALPLRDPTALNIPSSCWRLSTS
jgi:hypothetical protein